MAQILKGAPAAAVITEKLAERTEKLKSEGIVPTLAIVRIGERGDDISYETGAKKRCEKVGGRVVEYHLPEDCTKDQLLDTIREINEDDSIHGCLMFRPLQDKDMEEEACQLLDPAKDVDCMTSGSLAGVFTGSKVGYPPCTAQACMEMLDFYDIPLEGKRAVVIGRSLVIGKPVSMMLQQRNATVTMCHTRTKDMPAVCRDAEILIAAAGKAGVVGGEFVSQSQVIIDVGINVTPDGKLTGDVDFPEVEPKVAAISPVPAGVGSITTAVLWKHVVEATEKRLNK